MRWIGPVALAVVLAGALGGCVIKDEVKEGTRELRAGLKSLTVQDTGQGSAVVSFTFGYLLGLVDSEGIDAVEWIYSLRVPRGRELVRIAQEMRERQLDKTEVLVVGDRSRTFEVPRGSLEVGQTYVLWFELFYRGEVLGEVLVPLRLVAGEQIEVPFDADTAL